MTVVDRGHTYTTEVYDGEPEQSQQLIFMKREGPAYPGNTGSYPGTNIQEVLRVLIDRLQYLQLQVPCSENLQCILFLRQCIFLLERRAARRHNLWFDVQTAIGIERLLSCRICGHVTCHCGRKR